MKLTITVQNGSLAGRHWELEAGFLTVGRDAGCHLQFEPLNEKIVSTKHAFLRFEDDGFYLTDNKSTNGTFLNGNRIQHVRLISEDVIQFGINGPTATIKVEMPANIARQNSAPPPATPRTPDFQNQTVQQVQYLESDQMPSVAPRQTQPTLLRQPNSPPNVLNSLSGLGAPNVAIKPVSSETGKYIGVAAAIFSVVFLSLIVMLLILGNLGIIGAIIASVVAFTPALIYILPLIWLDRYDPEPPWALALAFAWGALVAVIISVIFNDTISAVAAGIAANVLNDANAGEELGQIIGTVISAPIFEEGSKGLGVILVLVFLRREFDDILDGIVYAGVIALGFATVENVLYYGRELLAEGFGGLIFLFGLRGILSPFAHVTFTSMTGIGCGISRESHNKLVRLTAPLLGYFCAIFLHFLWNSLATFGGLKGFLIGYVILEFPFFLIFVGFTVYVMRRQNRILKEMLAIDVARGMIPAAHLAIATSAFGSLAWIFGGLTNGKFNARRQYLRAIGKLGLSYWHIQRATKAHGQTASFQQNPILRDEVLKWRERV